MRDNRTPAGRLQYFSASQMRENPLGCDWAGRATRNVAVLGALSLLLPAPVWACSLTAPPPTLIGEPADGAEAVPTNVVFHYTVPITTLRPGDAPNFVPGMYALHSADAEQVELKVTRPTADQLELVPTEPLAPNTIYTLTARWKLADGTEPEDSLSFETGDGPDAELPEPPLAMLLSYQLTGNGLSSCGPYETGYPQHQRGITPEQGLYFLGLPWQHAWGSGRFSAVDQDAEHLADAIADA
jgi:hypothetical protein